MIGPNSVKLTTAFILWAVPWVNSGELCGYSTSVSKKNGYITFKLSASIIQDGRIITKFKNFDVDQVECINFNIDDLIISEINKFARFVAWPRPGPDVVETESD